MNLVLFKVNALGDNVAFVPVVQALRDHVPQARILLCTTPGEATLYSGPRGAHEIHTAAKRDFDKAYRNPLRLLALARRIRAFRPGASLVAFDQANVAHLLARWSGAGLRIGATLDHVRVRGGVTHEVARPADASPLTWNWEMGRALAAGLGAGVRWPERAPAPDLGFLSGAAAPRVPGRRRVVLHPGSGKRLNQWGRERFAAVARALARDAEVVWVEHGPSAMQAPQECTSARPAGLGDLAALLRTADLFVGNNSGPMHLAGALGVRGVCVAGPSAPGWDPLWNRASWTVLRHPSLSCGPCEHIDRELRGCANTGEPLVCLTY
jgi:ADP-heptose:LPS heptosyltransferase